MKLLDRSWFTWSRTKRIIIQTCAPRKDPWISKIDNGHFSYENVGKEISEINTQVEESQHWYSQNDEPKDIVYNEYHMLQRCDDDWSFGLDNYDDNDYPFDEEAYFNIHNAMDY